MNVLSLAEHIFIEVGALSPAKLLKELLRVRFARHFDISIHAEWHKIINSSFY